MQCNGLIRKGEGKERKEVQRRINSGKRLSKCGGKGKKEEERRENSRERGIRKEEFGELPFPFPLDFLFHSIFSKRTPQRIRKGMTARGGNSGG